MKYCKWAFVSLFVLINQVAQANLMITPNRINFDARDRVQDVILINSGNVARTYRLSWRENIAVPEGGYKEITLDDPNVDALSPFVRFSPRQVTLQPGERQVVKLQLRKRANMDASEYRSHLLFTALPPEQETSNQAPQPQDGMSFKLDLLMNYTIPVLYHPNAGKVMVNADFQEIKRRKDTSADFVFKLSRAGDVSSYGRLEMYANINGETKRIGLANNVSVFKELDHRMVRVRVPEFDDIESQLNQIELRYVGESEHSGQVFFKKNLQI